MATRTKKRAKACEHMTSRFTWSGHMATSRFCVDCGALLSMGPSNDEPAEVQVEILAAECAFSTTTPGDEEEGWQAHRLGRHLERGEIVPYLAGWLAREIATHDDREARDANAWPWDPTRTIADRWSDVPDDPIRVSHGFPAGGKIGEVTETLSRNLPTIGNWVWPR